MAGKPINIAEGRGPKSQPQWGITVSIDIINLAGLIGLLSLPPSVQEDEALEWADTCVKLWTTGGPYPTPDHEAFCEAIDKMWFAVAKQALGVALGAVISPEAVDMLRNSSQNDLTERPN